MFLTQKHDDTIKEQMVQNGKSTCEWLSKEDLASPTILLESIMLTTIVNIKEQQDVMGADIPNTFIQVHMPEIKNGAEQVVMMITRWREDGSTVSSPFWLVNAAMAVFRSGSGPLS